MVTSEMGEISYALMRILISKQIKKEVDELIVLRKAEAEALDKTDPNYTEKILSLSVKLGNECKLIALGVLAKHPRAVKGDPELQEYKKELTKNGT